MPQAAEIAAEFRSRLEAYFRAVDEWEQAYGSVYRLSMPQRISADLQDQYQHLEQCRNALKESMPQAKILCHRYGIRENWAGLLRVQLEAATPQNGGGSVIGRSERSAAMAALTELDLSILSGESSPAPRPRRNRSLLQMLLELF